MTQEQLMKVKIKFLEDRINTMEKSLGSIHKILGRFQMTENNDPFTRTIDQGLIDFNSDDVNRSLKNHYKKKYDHELI